ncbi:MAG: CxxC-x17-CxxC domain-containing protein [Methanothrix sp.]
MERYGSGNRGGFSSGPREMHDATCAECGKTCQVPFKPDGSRPVYCSDCYQKHKPARPAGASRPPRRY